MDACRLVDTNPGPIYRDEPPDDGGSGQTDDAGCCADRVEDALCGDAGQTDCDAWDCGELVGGGAGHAGAPACCAPCPGATLIRVGDEAGGFCAATFGFGFGFGLVASVAAAGGVGSGTATSALPGSAGG